MRRRVPTSPGGSRDDGARALVAPRRGVLALAAVVLAAGCLSPREDPSRFFLLTSGPRELADAPTADDGGSIAVGPLELPDYLSGPLLVTRVGEHEILESSYERWAEPLYDNILRVLATNLSADLGTRVVVYPALLQDEVRLRVPINVRRFERDTTGVIALWADWRIDRASTGATLRQGSSRVSQPSGAAQGEGSVAAMSEALATLSREIATAIRTVPSGGSDR